MLKIDGSFGEGGGQILRTSLALSLVTGKGFWIEKVRAGRKKPGLLRQHLTALKAAAEIGRAEVRGAQLGSQELTFIPGKVAPGAYHFAMGTAGSTTLVLQTVLPALLTAEGRSELILEGGTHNPFAPPFDFLEQAFLPLVKRMGPGVEVSLERPGFYPAGGGRCRVSVEPAPKLIHLEISERGEVRRRLARAMVARLSMDIARRELRVVREKLGWDESCLQAELVKHSRGPGNVLVLTVESEHVTEVFTGFGQRGLPAETVAAQAVEAARRYLAANVPVGEHLADQLPVLMALARGGSFRTLAPSGHTATNIEVLKHFLDVEVIVSKEDERAWRVEVQSR